MHLISIKHTTAHLHQSLLRLTSITIITTQDTAQKKIIS